MAGLGVNYSSVSKAIYALANNPEKVWSGPWELMRAVSAIPLESDEVQSVDIRLGLPKALLHALEAVYKASYAKNGEVTDKSCTIRDLKVVCIVGLHEHERKEKQRLELDVKVSRCDWTVWGHKGFADEVYEVGCAALVHSYVPSLTKVMVTVCEQLGLRNNRIAESRTGATSPEEPLSRGFRSASSRDYSQETIGNTFRYSQHHHSSLADRLYANCTICS